MRVVNPGGGGIASKSYPESFDGNGGVVPLPDGLVDVAILTTTQLMLHHNVRPASAKRRFFVKFIQRKSANP
jgi:hypothetical protein